MNKVLFVLKVILLLSLILFLFAFNLLSKTNCQACSFVFEEEKISVDEVLNLYEERCLKYGTHFWDIKIVELNITGQERNGKDFLPN